MCLQALHYLGLGVAYVLMDSLMGVPLSLDQFFGDDVRYSPFKHATHTHVTCCVCVNSNARIRIPLYTRVSVRACMNTHYRFIVCVHACFPTKIYECIPVYRFDTSERDVSRL